MTLEPINELNKRNEYEPITAENIILDSIDEYTEDEKAIVIDFKNPPKRYHRYHAASVVHIIDFRPQSKSLADFPDIFEKDELKKIKLLTFYGSEFTDFTSIERFSSVEKLSVYNNSSLISFDGLENLPVTTLELSNIPKITGYERLAVLSSISKLKLENCNRADSLDFIRDMTNLRFLTFPDTNIVSGDMSPLTEHKPTLDYVYFDNKEHYSHTYRQIWDILDIPDPYA